MNQQNRNEQLRAEAEARRSSGGGSASSWDRIQSALRRYLTTEGYRTSHDSGQGGRRATGRDIGHGRRPR